MQRYIFAAECARAGAPGLSPMGLRMVGPCIMRYGTPEQKAHYLPRILSGEDYWCQGYSEPGSGSDLASLQLRAVADGDDYVLNGSKIWTTHAHWANRMFCLVRTQLRGQAAGGHHLPAARHGHARHQREADHHPGRRARGQPGLLRRRARAEAEPAGRRRTTAGRSPNTCWSSSAAARSAPGLKVALERLRAMAARKATDAAAR